LEDETRNIVMQARINSHTGDTHVIKFVVISCKVVVIVTKLLGGWGLGS